MEKTRSGWIIISLFLLSSWAWYRLYSSDLRDSGSFGCEMSWMTPSYKEIDFNRSISRYSLYLYREHGWDDEQGLSSHVVIFVPGNAGSYQQIRSVASSISRQFHGHPGQIAPGMQQVIKPDVYTLDLNEDFSAFDGRVLEQQAAFLRESIQHIKTLHHEPITFSLLGHSMGGIVARLAVTQPDIEIQVDKIVTLSTPHLLPPITLDHEMLNVYRRISQRSRLPIISVCGGTADSQIASDACIGPETSPGLTVFSTGMMGTWTGCDHQAMVWCHQIRWRIARFLLESTRDPDVVTQLRGARQWLLPSVQPDEFAHPRRSIELAGPTALVTSSLPGSLEMCTPACSPINVDIQAIPRARSGPFPLPGEGVQLGDVDYVFVVNKTGQLSLAISPDAEVTYGGIESAEIRGLRWYPSRGVALVRIQTEEASTNSLLVRRLIVNIGECVGPYPLVRYTAKSMRTDVYEQRIFTTDSAILLQSHVGSAPYLRRHSAGYTIEVFQSATCPIRSVEVRLCFWRTLGKAFTRYRMAVLAWSIGWTGILAEGAMHAKTFGRILQVFVWLIVGFGLQCVVGTERLLLGVSRSHFIPLYGLLGIWTLLLTVSVRIMLQALRFVTKGLHRVSWSPNRFQLVGLCCIWIVVGSVVPQDLLLLSLLFWQFGVYCTSANIEALEWVLLISVFLSPFHLTKTLVQVRIALIDRAGLPVNRWGGFITLPRLIASFVAKAPPLPSGANTIVRILLLAWAVMSFVLGPVHTYLIDWSVGLPLMALGIAGTM